MGINRTLNSHLKLTPSKKRYRSSIMDFMMEEKGDDFYGGVGNYQVFKGSRKIYKGHCSGVRFF